MQGMPGNSCIKVHRNAQDRNGSAAGKQMMHHKTSSVALPVPWAMERSIRSLSSVWAMPQFRELGQNFEVVQWQKVAAWMVMQA